MINLSNMKIGYLISAGLLLGGWSASAQEGPKFAWEAKLPRVDSPGFYRIPVTAALSARAHRNGEWDIRILGSAGEVPYVPQQMSTIVATGDFKAYGTPKLESVPGKETTIIFEPQLNKSISEFGFRYANTHVRKKAVLTGSADMVQWFAIREPFLLDPSAAIPVEGKPTILEETISMPLSGYRYYKLVIDDSASAPLQINCVGYRSVSQQQPAREELSGVKMQLLQGKDRRTDRFLITLPDRYPVRRISMVCPRPLMFHRSATLRSIENGAERLLVNTILQSDAGVQTISLPGGRMYDRNVLDGVFDSLILQVDNGDSPPLVPEQVKAWRDVWHLVAHLEPGDYVLAGGASMMEIPSYDVAYFQQAYYKQDAQLLAAGDPVETGGDVAEPEPKTFFTSRIWVWLGILVVVALLGFVVRSMIRDMQKRKD